MKGRYSMEEMGKQRITDKTIIPLQALTNITPSDATGGRTAGSLGMVPIAYYKGQAVFWDLNLAVNEPLVFAERQHILGILDGREEGYDLVTVNIPLGVATPVGTVYRGRLTVPAGQVWFITQVLTTLAAEAATPTAFWRCSLWADRAAIPDADGQAFNAVAMTFALGPVYWDDFFEGANVFLPNTNKPVALRLPAGSSITLQLITTVLGTAGSAHTLQLFGYIGKALVA